MKKKKNKSIVCHIKNVLEFCFALSLIFVLIIGGVYWHYASNSPELFLSDTTKSSTNTYYPFFECGSDKLTYYETKILNGERCILYDVPGVPYISEAEPVLYRTIQNQNTLSLLLVALAILRIIFVWLCKREKKIKIYLKSRGKNKKKTQRIE